MSNGHARPSGSDSTLKRAVQTVVGWTGYKIVRLRPYEARNTSTGRNPRHSSKVFGIGYNKTGSTTLEAILRHYGFRLPKQLDQERILSKLPFDADWERLKGFVADYDAFQDLPFSQYETWIACDVLFPSSKFILTVREPDVWFRSYERYYRKVYGFSDGDTAPLMN